MHMPQENCELHSQVAELQEALARLRQLEGGTAGGSGSVVSGLPVLGCAAHLAFTSPRSCLPAAAASLETEPSGACCPQTPIPLCRASCCLRAPSPTSASPPASPRWSRLLAKWQLSQARSASRLPWRRRWPCCGCSWRHQRQGARPPLMSSRSRRSAWPTCRRCEVAALGLHHSAVSNAAASSLPGAPANPHSPSHTPTHRPLAESSIPCPSPPAYLPLAATAAAGQPQAGAASQRAGAEPYRAKEEDRRAAGQAASAGGRRGGWERQRSETPASAGLPSDSSCRSHAPTAACLH
jgi:hypothetical protein